MLNGTYRFVTDMSIQLRNPWDPSNIINAKYSGETVRGIAHGLGEFIWGEEQRSRKCHRGFGTFRHGKLHGNALIYWKSGLKESAYFIEDVMNGQGIKYYPEGT